QSPERRVVLPLSIREPNAHRRRLAGGGVVDANVNGAKGLRHADILSCRSIACGVRDRLTIYQFGCHAFAALLQDRRPVLTTAKACRLCKFCMLSQWSCIVSELAN